MGVQLRTEEKRILETLELELPCEYLVSNLHPLEEQSVLETTNSLILNKDVKSSKMDYYILVILMTLYNSLLPIFTIWHIRNHDYWEVGGRPWKWSKILATQVRASDW